MDKKIGDIDKNSTRASALVTTIVLNTKFGGVEKIVPNVTDLAKKRNYGAKIKEIEKKYFTTADCNNFTSETFDAKIKQE